MSLSPDPRLAIALRDDGQARTMLSGLHQQIVACRDERLMCALLAKYSALALARQALGAASVMQRASRADLVLQNAIMHENRVFQTLSNASKARHDVAQNSIRNMKA